MCKRKTYTRFSKLYDNINGSRVFDTKLGPRCVVVSRNKEFIYVSYYDKDNSELFHIGIKKSGKIIIRNTKIDEHAIFAAIYEIECIINDKKQKYKDHILEKLFESIDEYSIANRFNFTQYR